jgi:hypothetical protein
MTIYGKASLTVRDRLAAAKVGAVILIKNDVGQRDRLLRAALLEKLPSQPQ